MYDVEHSTSSKILNSLWILFSITLILPGAGLVYVGSKTSNDSWIKEGFIYEIPWVLVVITIGFSLDKLSSFFVLILLFCMLVALIRSLLINSQYQDILETHSYRASKNRQNSLLWLVFSVFPYINGVGFIVVGIQDSNNKLIGKGIFYEVLWLLSFMFSATMFFKSVAFSFLFLSLLRAINVNYTSDLLSNTVYGNSPSDLSQNYTFEDDEFVNKSNQDLESKDKLNVNSNQDSNTFASVSAQYSKPADIFDDKYIQNLKPVVNVEVKSAPYESYRPQINDLREDFDSKEEKIVELINRRFASQITRDKFMDVINSSHENFYNQTDSALSIVDLASQETPKIEEELLKKIDILESIIDKIDKLTTELIININEDKKADENLKNLVEDMEDLIESVKQYD